jgi:4-coumarate--CoA ligase
MPIQSSFQLDIPECDVLSYLFSPNSPPSKTPLWIESTDPSKYLSQYTLIREIRRFALGLKTLGVKSGDVIMVQSGNHIYVPVVFFGAMACGAIFSGANPTYTVPGKENIQPHKNSSAQMQV